MKRHFILILAVLTAIVTVSCSSQDKAIQEKIKPVRVIEVKELENQAVLNYTGIVSSSELKKLAFKSTGRITGIRVKEGQKIKKGEVLLELETQDLQYALAAAKGQAEAARSRYEKAKNGATAEELKNAELNVKKAQDAYDFAMRSYKRLEALYNSGAASRNDLDKVELEVDVRESELNQAKEVLSQVKNGARPEDKKALLSQLEQAEADYAYKAALVQDAVMKADVDGFVVEIPYEKGEMIPSGYPAIIVRNDSLVVNVGLAEKDMKKITLGISARINAAERTIAGIVTNISQVPNAQTRTYGIEITLEQNDLNVGAVVEVELITGNERGIWIPLTSMLSDGVDYVYLARSNMAEKREIVVESISGSMAKVKGLVPGEELVVEGMKRLRAGDGISVLK